MEADLDLAARYRSWETDDLVRAATVEAESYTPEALEAIGRELGRRGHSTDPASLTVAGLRPATEEAPRGLGGLLLVLIIVLACNSVVALVYGADVFDASHSLFDRLTAAGAACIGAYGILCCVLLLRKDRRAPSRAAGWFVSSAVLAIVVSLYKYFVAGSLDPIMFTFINTGIWLTYLSKSKRIKATYGISAEW
ncbi:MAG TPA: DUF2569 family protein [Thermoanaerobaculia bacterium]|nr:DUF2569 family protein [Thermoanaerobaculia bacterium]